MNLLMTATPIAMTFCGHPFAATTTVIEWHVVAMFAPGFVTGSLIARVGVMKVIAAGIAVMCLAVAVALHGLSTAHFVASLALVGIGWNFMYTGATTLLMASHTPAEKARVQGVNDLILFVAMALSSLGSGALVTKGGWATANWVALAVLTLVALALVLIHGQRSPMRSAATA
jgi:MFS family permease